MADAIWTDEGLFLYLRSVCGQEGDQNPIAIHLFKNDFTPDEDSDIDDFEECDFDSYSPIDAYPSGVGGVTGHVMSSPHDDPHGGSFHSPLTWVIVGTPVVGQLVYGYFATYFPGSGPLKVTFHRRFDSPRPMLADGDTISFNLTITLRRH